MTFALTMPTWNRSWHRCRWRRSRMTTLLLFLCLFLLSKYTPGANSYHSLLAHFKRLYTMQSVGQLCFMFRLVSEVYTTSCMSRSGHSERIKCDHNIAIIQIMKWNLGSTQTKLSNMDSGSEFPKVFKVGTQTRSKQCLSDFSPCHSYPKF